MSNYERITAAILAALETDLPPWRRDWRTLRSAGASGIPVNAVSRRAYRGINFCLLASRFDADSRYLTYRQAQQFGGHVRKGEHGTTIVFWQKRRYTKRDETGAEETRDGLLMKAYTVFSLSQTDGVKLPEPRDNPAPQPVPPTIADVYAKCGATLEHGGDVACYAPGPDKIIMPAPEAFTTPDAYSATALHELTHFTGHRSRLARDLTGRFGSQAYAAEELVAELGAAYQCAALGINSALEHHASYLANWRKLLASDPRAIITAASKAQQASDWIAARLNPAGATDALESEAV